jgi:hypothetical protein
LVAVLEVAGPARKGALLVWEIVNVFPRVALNGFTNAVRVIVRPSEPRGKGGATRVSWVAAREFGLAKAVPANGIKNRGKATARSR